MIKKIPAVKWMSEYKSENLSSDILAGIIVAIMLIPQGMAYAMLAGLPPEIGLYSSTIPLIIYALFGSSRHLAIGPVAMVSLLVAEGISGIATSGSSEYIKYALILALMVGVIQFLLGIFKLGFIVNFLSHAVISGFTSAAALIIGLSQLKHLLGIDLGRGKTVFHLIYEAIMRINEVNIIALLIGIISIAILYFVKKKFPKFPTPLIVVMGSILIVKGFNLNELGVSIVGDIPKGLPSFSFHELNFDVFSTLFPIALVISFVSFMESIAVAKALAAKDRYNVDSNKELIGLGLANIVGSFFSSYPVTGGFSRSAVNYQSNAKTGLASIITALIIIVTLIFFTGLFYYLPNAVLASIIMVSVFGLIDIKEAKYLFKVKKADGWTLVITFISTLVLGIERGILVGVGVSLLIFIWERAYPHIAELGYLEEEGVFRDVAKHPNAKTYKEGVILRVDASLYFANMKFLEDKLCNIIGENKEIKWFILDFSGVNKIDGVSIHSLEGILGNCKNKEVEFYLSGIKGSVMDMMKRAKLDQRLGNKIKYLTINHALKKIEPYASK
ncbi:SulP family inorganic anion transporter [Senegalia massiliensis]|uniref:SulP family inorganic anion transporter n=1 Tax=Senegalia massiliensis TaxID=1720316 RepID=UPI00102FB538|nr:solute carrier family 26 protein [Senegalia massiliensis]